MTKKNKTANTGRAISLTEMASIESSTHDAAWIVAEDRVVDYLVLNHLSDVTVTNICRGVNYRFLVSDAKLKEMQDFAVQTRGALLNTAMVSPNRQLGRIDVHAISPNMMNIAMPGCLFDPYDLAHGRSYFRTCMEVDKKLTFMWVELSSTHHTQYLEGFKAAWPPSLDQLGKAIRFLGIAALSAACIVILTAVACLRVLSLDPAREVVWAIMLGGATWLVVVWGVTWHPRSSLVRRTLSFVVFERVLGIVCAGFVLGVLVNILTSWLWK